MVLEKDLHLTPDMMEMLQEEQARGADGSDIGYPEVDAPEIGRTFPRAANKDAEFICGCTTEIDAGSEGETLKVKQIIAEARAKLPTESSDTRATHRDTSLYHAGRNGWLRRN